ncbi:uncharacterized protein CELE_F44F4.15 [Caenorhabditis elegans]|uniref:Transmembrane protein n=1 Tax=Caenorhabditis elegans TaxID=6239 RepID=A0A3P6PAT3_CAEEL|nr:Transmembrane protein [Caenorhabditis elegans]VDJ62565.1 Transmembrane protein [Caenorhabditis elegans]|eukprot:NP_001355500.1 Uncharacterized protein CELE_F44F4.15 [Caenorhabditis elegans]
MDFKSTYLLIMFAVKAINATRNISIFEAYFNVIQCSLFFFFTAVVLITTAISFYQTTPPKLTFSKPSLSSIILLWAKVPRIEEASTQILKLEPEPRQLVQLRALLVLEQEQKLKLELEQH